MLEGLQFDDQHANTGYSDQPESWEPAMAPVLTESSCGSDSMYEVVDGQIVEMEPMGAREARLASLLMRYLDAYADEDGLGQAVTEALVDLTDSVGRKRRPDVMFVSSERWSLDKPIPEGEDWKVVPDLAVEIVSPSNAAVEIMDKVEEYFAAGVRAVWVIYPRQQQIYLYRSLTEVTVVAATGELAGDPVLPGFRLPLSKLFRHPVAAE